MNKVKILAFTLALFIALPAVGQQRDSDNKIKSYINDVVQKVEKANDAVEKRVILNESFDKLITVFDKVEKLEKISEQDRSAIADLRETIIDRKSELNGKNGFNPVPGNQLNDFANFVQQDLEQADTFITISAGLAVLIVILLLLL